MLAIVRRNPEILPGRPKSVERSIVDGRELILVDETHVWTVYAAAGDLAVLGLHCQNQFETEDLLTSNT